MMRNNRLAFGKTQMRRIVCGISLAALGAGLGACGRGTTEEPPRIRPVRYQEIVIGGGERVRHFSGTAQASRESKLSFRVSGIVDRLGVKVGQRVEAGALIARLDSRDYELEVGRAKAELSLEEAKLRNAAAEFERVKDLYENDNASLTALDAARANFETAKALVAAATQALELANARVGYTRLTAPVAGFIGSIYAERNEIVGPGQVIATLNSGSRPEVEISIPEALIARIREGDAATVTFDAIPGETLEATVTEVAVASGDGRTTFPVTVVLDELHESLRSGMAAEVGLTFGSSGARPPTLVPAVAVGEDEEGRFVFVVEDIEDGIGTARRREVVTGELVTSGLEILAGLRDGDILVVRGLNHLADGMPVRLLEERQLR